RIDDAFVHPQRHEIAALVERLDDAALFSVGENPVGLGSKEVANLLGDWAVGGVERGEWVRRRLDRQRRFGRRRGDRIGGGGVLAVEVGGGGGRRRRRRGHRSARLELVGLGIGAGC